MTHLFKKLQNINKGYNEYNTRISNKFMNKEIQILCK